MAVTVLQYQKPLARRPMKPLLVASVAGFAIAAGVAAVGVAAAGTTDWWRGLGVGGLMGLGAMSFSLAALWWAMGQPVQTLLAVMAAGMGLRAVAPVVICLFAVKVGGYPLMQTAVVGGWICLGVLAGETVGLKKVMALESAVAQSTAKGS